MNRLRAFFLLWLLAGPVDAAEVEMAVLDQQHIQLTLDRRVEREAVVAEGFRVRVDGEAVTVAAAGFSRFVSGFDGAAERPRVASSVYLQLVEPLPLQGTLQVESALAESGSVAVGYDLVRQQSELLKINQVGFPPDGPKRLYLGGWLGDLGALSLPDGLPVRIVEAESGAIVLEGRAVAVTAGDEGVVSGVRYRMSGESVQVFDFTALARPGRYHAEVEGLGRSVPFRIGPAVHAELFRLSARALFYQRSGEALLERYAGAWARPASHGSEQCGFYHNSVRDLVPELYAGEPVGGAVDLSGGWFDASDYNKYTRSAAQAVISLLAVFEGSGGPAADDLNVPESGNGIPDLLDEAMRGLDWLAKMVGSNGAVFNKVSHAGWHHALPHKVREPMWAITRTTYDTAAACAALAKGARLVAAYDPARAAHYREKALRAWQCLERHPERLPVVPKGVSSERFGNPDGNRKERTPDIRTGPYFRGENDLARRAAAAVELFRLTGEPRHHEALQALCARPDFPGWGDEWWHIPFNFPAAISYLHEPARDPALAARMLEECERAARQYVKNSRAWPYAVSLKSLSGTGLGNPAMSTRYAFHLLLLYEVTGAEEWLEAAQLNLDFQLGANPLSRCFMTGVGSNPVRYPRHTISRLSAAGPVPGLCVYGPSFRPGRGAYGAAVATNAWPPLEGEGAYPVARRYADAYELIRHNEFVIDDLARSAAVFGWFSARSSQPVSRSRPARRDPPPAREEKDFHP